MLEELRMISTLNGLPVEERVFVFVCAAFGPECVKAKAVEKYADVLKGLMLKVDEAGYQRRLLGVMEFLCAVKHPELRRFFPVLLKQLYEEEVVDEAVFLEWDEEEGQRTDYTRRELTDDMVPTHGTGIGVQGVRVVQGLTVVCCALCGVLCRWWVCVARRRSS